MTSPLLRVWDAPFGLPPFDHITEADFAPAFEAAMVENLAEIDAITSQAASPDFDNTIGAMERSGRLLDRVAAVFFNLCSSHTNDALQAVQREMAPKLAAHHSAVLMNAALFKRVEALVDAGESLDLSAEEARVLELYHRLFVNAGARLQGRDRERMKEILQRLATLGTDFGQNVLADEKDWALILERSDLDGLPDFLISAAAREAKSRGRAGAFAITLSRSSVEPFLVFSTRRDLRETAFRAWIARGEGANWPLVEETVKLRAEKAELLGYSSFADFKLHDQMAKTPEAVRELLSAVWEPAKRRAGEEAAALAGLAASEGANIDIAPWDWRHYAEKRRKLLHDLDEAETKPYLALDAVIDAAFDVAGRLFGLGFREVEGLILHHPDARAWEVTGRDGRHVGLFIGDYFARPSKRSGAWMSGFRGQQKLWEPGRPIVVNTLNIAPGGEGEPALLTWDDARTVFHEFGHGLHGLLSKVRYESLGGTNVKQDFVELPSQIMEHWATEPEVLRTYARHIDTGEPIPDDLIEKLRASETFNQGFATTEYLAACYLDLAWHGEDGEGAADVESFESSAMRSVDLIDVIEPRYRSSYFQHIFTGDHYSAGYYVYMWAEVLDADGFEAFKENGLFDPETAQSFRRNILERGGTVDPMDLYRAFRGREPDVQPLLVNRGLT